MQLKTQVIIISIFQALIDIGGIITAIQFNEIVESIEINFQSSVLENATKNFRKQQDYRSIESVNILYYTLPYFFSGVIPRMLNGFQCLTADQLVIEHLSEWKKVVQIKENNDFQISSVPIPSEYWRSILNDTEINLSDSIERREQHCSNSNYKIPHISLDETMRELHYLEDFEKRKKENKNKTSIYLMCWFELATMASNSIASALIAIITIFRLQLPMLHVPWLLLTAIEITGNICVALAFSVVPGYCLLTSFICITRAIWLGTIWSKTIRNKT